MNEAVPPDKLNACIRAQLEEVDVLLSMYCESDEFRLVQPSDEQLQALRELLEKDDTSDDAIVSVVSSQPSITLCLLFKVPVPDPERSSDQFLSGGGAHDVEAVLSLTASFPPGYPLSCGPSVQLEPADAASGKLISPSLLRAFLEDMREHMASLLGDVCVYDAVDHLSASSLEIAKRVALESMAAAPKAAPGTVVHRAGVDSDSDGTAEWLPPRVLPQLLGRPKTNIKVGLVGLPNVGKSSLFNLLSGLSVPAENYPFCTIDPNIAVCPVPDSKYEWLLRHLHANENRSVPPVLQVVDIAGLVKGASKGEGLGNAFLHHVSTCHVICHVVRGFGDLSVEHTEGNVNPIRDLDIIEGELRAKDLFEMEKRYRRLDKKVPLPDKVREKERQDTLCVIRKAMRWLRKGRALRHKKWSQFELEYLSTQQMWTSKPIMVILNMGLSEFKAYQATVASASTNEPDEKVAEVAELSNHMGYRASGHGGGWVAEVEQWIQEHSPEASMVPVCASFEQILLKRTQKEAAVPLSNAGSSGADVDPDVDADADADATKVAHAEQKHAVDTEDVANGAAGLDIDTDADTGVSAAVHVVKMHYAYKSVRLMHFYTFDGPTSILRAITLLTGTDLVTAVGKIHHSLRETVVSAEVYNVDALMAQGDKGLLAVKAAGQVKLAGKGYIVQDGDIIRIKQTQRNAAITSTDSGAASERHGKGKPSKQGTGSAASGVAASKTKKEKQKEAEERSRDKGNKKAGVFGGSSKRTSTTKAR